jgi:hypothetical protein
MRIPHRKKERNVPRARLRTEDSGRVREVVLTEIVPSEMLGALTRSVRRASARRARHRRAAARNSRRDRQGGIIEFLAGHPGSTTGDLAKRLNLDP